jgi:hypothetical protein
MWFIREPFGYPFVQSNKEFQLLVWDDPSYLYRLRKRRTRRRWRRQGLPQKGATQKEAENGTFKTAKSDWPPKIAMPLQCKVSYYPQSKGMYHVRLVVDS